MSSSKSNPTSVSKEHANARAKALVQDSLKRYLADIRKYPVISREDEQVLAHKVVAGDEKAAQQLVNANLRLVVKIALEYQSNRVPVLDLIQEGNVGLLQAVQKFDPERKIRLSTYAQFWIRAYVLKYLMDNYKLVKVGTTQAQRKLFYNLKKEKEKLRQQGLKPTAARLAKELDVREKDVVEMEGRLAGREVSLDAPVADDSSPLMDILPSREPKIDKEYDRRIVQRHLSRRLGEFRSELQGRDSEIWDSRLVSHDPITLQELGDHFGVSRERARQLEARIVKKLTKFLRPDREFIEAME